MNAGRALRLARRRRGLSQQALAALTRVSQPAIARIESGRVVPRVDTLERLLQGCGETLETQPALGTGVDRTLIRELLALSPAARLRLAASEAGVLQALDRASSVVRSR